MRQTNKIVLIFCVCGGSILLGMIVNYWNEFTMDFEIKFFDLVTILFAGSLAYYITKNLEKSESEDRSEKEFLIEEMKKINMQVRHLLESINETPLYLDIINSQIYDLQLASNRVENQIKEDFTHLYNDLGNNLSLYITDVDNLLTNDTNPRITFSSQEGNTICSLQDDLILELENIFHEIEDFIFMCIIKINRA